MSRTTLFSRCLLCSLTLLAFTGVTRGDVVSTFDTDSDGWLVKTVLFMGEYPPSVIQTLDPTYVPTGGDPGGFIRTDDPDGNDTVFVAPSKFLGPKLDYIGGTLSFSLRDAFNDGIQDNLVALVGDDRTLFARSNFPPTDVFGHFTINLSASNFVVNSPPPAIGPPATDADLMAVLSNLNAILIQADWHTGDDLSDLDTVQLQTAPVSEPTSPVSEPTSLLLFGVGAAGLLVYCWRRQPLHVLVGRDAAYGP